MELRLASLTPGGESFCVLMTGFSSIGFDDWYIIGVSLIGISMSFVSVVGVSMTAGRLTLHLLFKRHSPLHLGFLFLCLPKPFFRLVLPLLLHGSELHLSLNRASVALRNRGHQRRWALPTLTRHV